MELEHGLCTQSVKPLTNKSLFGFSLLALFLILLSSPFIAIAGTIQLPQTGQKTCYDTNGVVISCPGTGQDGDIQAGVPWPSPRFIDHGNDTVTDNLTGLMWTKNANLPGTYKTWQQALDYVAGMNAGTYPNFGYTDWRLPNINELESLIDAERWGPALPAGHPFTNVQGFYYWSSTSYADSSFYAWLVNMYYGYMSSSVKSSDASYCVWPVRSGQVGPLVHSIIGQVTENSVGLSGITMTLSGAASATTTTASDGTYSFADLADGSYTVTPGMDGYTFSPTSIDVTIAGADVTEADFQAYPIVGVTLIPDSTSVARGGTLGYTVTVKNNTNASQTFQYWTYVTLPNANRYPATGELFGPVNVTLNPGQTKNAHLTHNIPNTAPLGTYTYYGQVGPYPVVRDSDSFNFDVTTAP